ncbi:hypothetical protein ACFL1Q_00330 [Patescibacteria group bacterium]
MHAFLIVGPSETSKQEEVKQLIIKLKATRFDFPLAKIADVRSLNQFSRLGIDKPTVVVCDGLSQATEEAQNAFLKNLEEPQDNLYYMLVADSFNNILPTIISRCQIIKVKKQKTQTDNQQVVNFCKLSVGKKLAYINTIKEREKAKEFVESLITFLHKDVAKNGYNLEVSLLTFKRLKANGNVNFQLANLVISLV